MLTAQEIMTGNVRTCGVCQTKKIFKNKHGYGTAITCKSGCQCLTHLNPFMPLLLICCKTIYKRPLPCLIAGGEFIALQSPNFQLLYLIHQSYPTKIGENTKDHEIPWGSRVNQHKLMWKTPWNSLAFRMGK